jgi:hypothetical protein
MLLFCFGLMQVHAPKWPNHTSTLKRIQVVLRSRRKRRQVLDLSSDIVRFLNLRRL